MTDTTKYRIVVGSFAGLCVLLLGLLIVGAPNFAEKKSAQLKIPYTMICPNLTINNVRRSQGNVYLDNKRIYPGADCTFIPEKGTNQ